MVGKTLSIVLAVSSLLVQQASCAVPERFGFSPARSLLEARSPASLRTLQPSDGDPASIPCLFYYTIFKKFRVVSHDVQFNLALSRDVCNSELTAFIKAYCEDKWTRKYPEHDFRVYDSTSKDTLLEPMVENGLCRLDIEMNWEWAREVVKDYAEAPNCAVAALKCKLPDLKIPDECVCDSYLRPIDRFLCSL